MFHLLSLKQPSIAKEAPKSAEHLQEQASEWMQQFAGCLQ